MCLWSRQSIILTYDSSPDEGILKHGVGMLAFVQTEWLGIIICAQQGKMFLAAADVVLRKVPCFPQETGQTC